MTYRALSDAHDAVLLAVDRAAFDSDEGWVTATEIAFALDGRASGKGVWARKLWDLRAEGLLETRDGYFPGTKTPYRVIWGLTDLGAHAARALSDGVELVV